MGKAYLKYEQIAGFGVVASTAAPLKQVRCSKSGVPFIACATVDILTIWNLRTGEAIARFGNATTRKAGAISALAVSASGDTIACGYTDGSIRLWTFSTTDLSSQQQQQQQPFSEDEPQPVVTFNGHRSGVSALAFDTIVDGASVPDTLVSGSNDGDVIVWNVIEATGVFRIAAHSDAITAVLLFKRKEDRATFVVSASKDALVKIYDKETQHCIQTIAESRAEVWALNMDPTNQLLFVGSVGSEVRVYALKGPNENENENEKEEEEENNGQKKKATMDDLLSFDKESIFKSLGFVERAVATDRIASIESTSHAGERYVVVSATDKTAEVFRLRTDEQAEVHRKRREKRKLASIERDVRATGEEDGWDAEKVQSTLDEQKKEVSFSLEAVDYMVTVRQLKMRKKLRSVLFLASATYIPIEHVNSGIELQLVMQMKDNALEIHNVTITGGGKNKNRKRRKGKMLGLGDGEIDDHDVDEEDKKKNVDEIKKLVTLDFPGHRNDVRSVSLSPEENTILSTSDGALKLWNVATQKCVRTMTFSGYGLCTHFLGADGIIGVVGTKSGMVQVYELGSGALITQEQAHSGEVWSLCLNDHIYDAKCLLTGGADKRVCFWSIDDVLLGRRVSNDDNDDDDDDGPKLELTRVLEMPDQVLCVRVAHERERPIVLVSMMDSTVRAYFLDTLEPYLNFYGHKLPVMSMDVSSDGLMLATGSADKTLKLWGLDFGDCRRSLRAHSESVLSVAFQPKTHYVFTGSRDGTLKYWDADKFEMICEIEGQRGEVWSLSVSGDGEIVATASHDRMIRVWRRTDEPLFLDEEKDRRMDQLFESKLIEDDMLQAAKTRKDATSDAATVGFMHDEGRAESSAAGKRSMETIKGGEAILEALQLCEEDNSRIDNEPRNPVMLGLSPNAYMLRALERIPAADLEEALQIVPLDAAVHLIDYLCALLEDKHPPARLVIEMLVRTGLTIIKMHHSQICAGAAKRAVVAKFHRLVIKRTEQVRNKFAVNQAALKFWKNQLAERDDRPFRDARARVYNKELTQRDKARKAISSRKKRKRMESDGDINDDMDILASSSAGNIVAS